MAVRDHKASEQDWRATNHASRLVRNKVSRPVLPWIKTIALVVAIGIAAHQAYTYFQGVVG